MPRIDDERYPSKKWLRDIDKDSDMMRTMTMVMNDDDGDKDGAWLNGDTTISRRHCGQLCFPSYAFRNSPSLWDRHGVLLQGFDLHCLQESNQTQSKEITRNQKAIESNHAQSTRNQKQSDAIKIIQAQSKRNQYTIKRSQTQSRILKKRGRDGEGRRGPPYAKRRGERGRDGEGRRGPP
jgi:hypothetical protein